MQNEAEPVKTEEAPEATPTQTEGASDQDAPKSLDPKEIPTAEKPKEDTAEKPKEPEVNEDFNYNQYDDPLLQQVTDMFKTANIKVSEANEIFKAAADAQDLSLIDKDALKEKLGDKADVALALVENYFNKQQKIQEAALNTAVQITGDKETFTAMTEWAKEKAQSDPEFASMLQDAISLVNTGKTMAIKGAVQELFEKYKEDPNTTIAGNIVQPTTSAGEVQVSPMSRVEYALARQDIYLNHKGDQKMLNALWNKYQQSNKK